MITLRPPLLARLMNANVGLLPWVAAVAIVADEPPLPDVYALPFVVVGGWISWRGYRLSVVCANGAVVVNGWFRDYPIPCTRITHLDQGLLPGISWTDDRGRDHHTRINAFRGNTRWPSLDASHAKNLKRLRDYVRKHRRRS